MDLCFLGEEKDPHNTITVMVARERSTRMTMAMVVWRLVAFMKEVGIFHSDLLVKSDQEPAVKSILSNASTICGERRSIHHGAESCGKQPGQRRRGEGRCRASSSMCGSCKVPSRAAVSSS